MRIELEQIRLEVYTFVDAETKENVHINSTALRRWCVEHRAELKVEMTPVEEQIARRFLEVDNSILPANLARVSRMKELDPVIYCKTGTYTNGAPDVMLVDGHHRYFLAAARGVETISGFLLELEQWKPFVLDLPDVSEDYLRLLPPKGGL